MAQKVQVHLIDDIDGTDAAETVTFALDGIAYEIDLSEAHASELRDAFAQWVGHARKPDRRRAAPRRGAATGRSGSVASSSASDAGKIREWARANGYEVSERGRISAEVREAYQAAN